MRISDWSSDVCSSDLDALVVLGHRPAVILGIAVDGRPAVEADGEIDAGDGPAVRPGDDDGGHRAVDLAGLALRHRRLCRFRLRSEEHTSELQSLMRISYAVFCLKKQNNK